MTAADYQFTYRRESDGASSVILLIPETRDDKPDFVIVRPDPSLPIWRRILSEVSLPRAEAEELRREHYTDCEVRPHIDVLSFY